MSPQTEPLWKVEHRLFMLRTRRRWIDSIHNPANALYPRMTAWFLGLGGGLLVGGLVLTALQEGLLRAGAILTLYSFIYAGQALATREMHRGL